MPKRTVVSEPPFVSPFGYGTCFCGCGEKAPIADRSDKLKGHIIGYPKRFVYGHQKRPPGVPQYIVDEETGCWEWQWNKGQHGYGYMADDDENGNRVQMRLAHRVFYTRKHGPIPKGLQLHHKCENRICCNPDHVIPLTAAQHTQDRAQKLNWEKVREIRRRCEEGATRRELAVEYGVHPGTIGSIKTGRTWIERETACPSCGHRFDPYNH